MGGAPPGENPSPQRISPAGRPVAKSGRLGSPESPGVPARPEPVVTPAGSAGAEPAASSKPVPSGPQREAAVASAPVSGNSEASDRPAAVRRSADPPNSPAARGAAMPVVVARAVAVGASAAATAGSPTESGTSPAPAAVGEPVAERVLPLLPARPLIARTSAGHPISAARSVSVGEPARPPVVPARWKRSPAPQRDSRPSPARSGARAAVQRATRAKVRAPSPPSPPDTTTLARPFPAGHVASWPAGTPAATPDATPTATARRSSATSPSARGNSVPTRVQRAAAAVPPGGVPPASIQPGTVSKGVPTGVPVTFVQRREAGAAAPPPAPSQPKPETGGGQVGGLELDELARRLLEPVSRLLRAELRQGRERFGRPHDRRR